MTPDPRRLFDEAARNPVRRRDLVGSLFATLGAAAESLRQEDRAARMQRRAAQRAARGKGPQSSSAASAAALRGWETRRLRESTESPVGALDDERARTGPVCEQMNHNGIGREVFCQEAPGHPLDVDHDDGDGNTWENEGY